MLAIIYLLYAFIPCGLCSDGAVIGGYDVQKIAQTTLKVLHEKKVLPDKQFSEFEKLLPAKQSDPLASGSSMIDLYAQLGAYLVEKAIASEEDIAAAKTASAESGGIKIGGYNPVILSASFLNILVTKNIISLSEAQSILDSSKISK